MIIDKAPIKRNKQLISSELALYLLKPLSPQISFLFFTDMDQYTGQFASSLIDFSEKLNNVPKKSLEFHFRRGDFSKWIGETLEDKVLEDRINNLHSSLQGEKLRKSIQKIVKKRLDELRIVSLTD